MLLQYLFEIKIISKVKRHTRAKYIHGKLLNSGQPMYSITKILHRILNFEQNYEYYNYIVFLLMLIRQFLCIWLLFWQLSHQTLISLTDSFNIKKVTCFGNVELIGGKCTPCRPGWISINKKCINQAYFYASSLIYGYQNDTSCEVRDPFTGSCIICKVGFLLQQSNICKKIDCLIYSEPLRNCLDQKNLPKVLNPLQEINNFKNPEFASGENSFTLPQNKQLENISVKYEQKKLILPAFKIADSLTLLKPQSFKQKNSINLLEPSNNSQSYILIGSKTKPLDKQPKQQPSLIVNCIKYDGLICNQCEKGFLYNKLLNQCTQLNKQIAFQNNFDQKDQYCLIPAQNIGFNTKKCKQCLYRYYYNFFTGLCQKVNPLCRKHDHNGKCIECFFLYTLQDGNCIR